MRIAATIGTLSALSLLGLGPQPDHGHSQVLQIHERDVYAAFESFDGCVITDVNVTGSIYEWSNGTLHVEASAFVTVVDVCDSVPLLVADGLGDASVNISESLDSGTIHTTLVLYDQQNGVDCLADVDLAFTATGPMTPNHGVEVSEPPPGAIVFNGRSREATTHGVFRIYNHQFLGDLGNTAPEPSIFSVIQDSRLRYVGNTP